MYTIRFISKKEEIETCPVFDVNQFNWGGDYRPKAYGRLAWLEGKGFYLHMICEEANPVCHYHNDSDPVYLDSAMEAFFSLNPPDLSYFNFEFNASGALLAKFGTKRHGRIFFKEEELKAIERCVTTGSKQWEIKLLFPLEILKHYFPDFSPKDGTKIRLNFFKLAEGEEMTHFASYSPIQTEKPDFHRPEFFADGVFQKRN